MKGTGFIADLLLERYRADDLPAAQAAGLREAIAADEGLRQRLAALERSDADILAAYPPAVFAASVTRRAAREGTATNELVPKSPPRRPAWAPALAAGLVVLVAGGVLWRVNPPAPGESSEVSPSGDRPKGGSLGLHVYRKGGELRVERLNPGDVARPLDLVQLAYQAGGHRYGVIVSIDGRGVVTRHLPTEGDWAAALQAGGAIALDTAYRLDDAPRLERFYMVAADQPFPVSSVLAAAGRAGLDPSITDRLPLGGRFAQASFLLRKE